MAKTMCPNCGGEAERMEKDGKLYVLCPKEDKIFQITDTGAKLAARGKLSEIEERLAALEARLQNGPDRRQDPPPAGDDDPDGVDLEITWGESGGD